MTRKGRFEVVEHLQSGMSADGYTANLDDNMDDARTCEVGGS
jgi:hypothetical protein